MLLAYTTGLLGEQRWDIHDKMSPNLKMSQTKRRRKKSVFCLGVPFRDPAPKDFPLNYTTHLLRSYYMGIFFLKMQRVLLLMSEDWKTDRLP